MTGNVSSLVMEVYLSYIIPQIPKRIGVGQEIREMWNPLKLLNFLSKFRFGPLSATCSVRSSSEPTKPNCEFKKNLTIARKKIIQIL
uniref:Uncharacterized protein n=1 Tax=Lepeophtheirus salmonis TaxID=72036 RepID=A0A0K2UE36_LEPSM